MTQYPPTPPSLPSSLDIPVIRFTHFSRFRTRRTREDSTGLPPGLQSLHTFFRDLSTSDLFIERWMKCVCCSQLLVLMSTMPDSDQDETDTHTPDNSPHSQSAGLVLGDSRLINNIPDNFVKTLMQFYGFACVLHRRHDFARRMFIKGWQRYNPLEALPSPENEFALVRSLSLLFAFRLNITQKLFLAVNDRHLELVPDRTPVTVELTALLDDSVIQNWWAAYDVYYLHHRSMHTFHNTIISDWRQRYPTVALQLTRTDLGKVFNSMPLLHMHSSISQILTAEIKLRAQSLGQMDPHQELRCQASVKHRDRQSRRQGPLRRPASAVQ